MDVLLEILGWLFIALLVALIAVAALVRHSWHEDKPLSLLNEPIEFEIDAAPGWIHKPKTQNLLIDFEALGFKKHRVYRERPGGLKSMVLTNGRRDQFGEIRQTPAGLATGFSAETLEGMNLQVVSTELPGAFAFEPNKIVESRPGSSVAEQYEAFEGLIAKQPLKVIADGAFDARRQEQLNLDRNAPFDVHEQLLWQDGERQLVDRWRRHHENEPRLREAYAQLAAKAMVAIHREISENLVQSEDLDAATRTLYCSQFILFNPRLHHDGFREYLIELFRCWGEIKENRVKQLAAESVDAAELFTRFEYEFPELKLDKFYSVTRPIKAELYGYLDPDEED